jgi:hypothetical protein
LTTTRASIVDDRTRFGRALLIVGVVGAVGAMVVGVVGWMLATRVADTVTATIEPIAAVVVDVAATVQASQVMVSSTIDAIASIEDAVRSTARALDSVGDVLGEASQLAGGEVADSLDSAIATLPALADTGRVVDRTMRALSLVGVDYDPEVPLDESLTRLEQSLSPVPGQLREQVDLIDAAREDMGQISTDAGSLAAVLLEVRIDMLDAETSLASAAENAAVAADRIGDIERDIDTYDTLSRVMVLAATLALLAAASAPLLIGLHYLREGSQPERSQTPT